VSNRFVIDKDDAVVLVSRFIRILLLWIMQPRSPLRVFDSSVIDYEAYSWSIVYDVE
jgi:hypothetical protein